ncbi:MAG: transposase [Burkholderiales bacterium]
MVAPHSHSLRRGRVSIIDQVYVVTAATRHRQPVFSDWRLGRLVVAEFRHCDALGHSETLAYVVMPDHFHWLMRLRSATLDQVVRRVKGRSAVAVNRLRGAGGPLWQDGFHDRAIRREEDLRAVARYIVANPLRARLAPSLALYPLWDAVWL